MEYSRGNYFVIKPLVDPTKHYDYGHIVSINMFPENCPVEELGKYSQHGIDEWQRCVTKIKRESTIHRPTVIDGIEYTNYDYHTTLKPEVIAWLNDYVPDSTDRRRKDMPKGWMIYHPDHTIETTSVNVFFLRRVDALAFIIAWG